MDKLELSQWLGTIGVITFLFGVMFVFVRIIHPYALVALIMGGAISFFIGLAIFESLSDTYQEEELDCYG